MKMASPPENGPVLTARRVFALAFVALLVLHFDALFDPPYWDALVGAFAQGRWLVTHSTSPWSLLSDSPAYVDGGACVYPFSVYPWIVALLEKSGLATTPQFVILHVFTFACAATTLAGTFAIVAPKIGRWLALLVVTALFAQPMFQALACQMNMDAPLTACTVLALLALGENRFRAATWWTFAALAVKPTGIILVVAVLVSLAARARFPRTFGLDDAQRARARRCAFVVAFLFAVFVVEFAITEHFGKGPPGVTALGGFVPLLTRRLWTLPEFALALVVFLALTPWIARRAFAGRAAAIEIDSALFLVMFVMFFGQYQNVLPRYFLQAWPALFASLAFTAIAFGAPRRVVGVALALIAVYGVVNAHGRFHPTKFADWNDPNDPRPLVANDGWVLERSLEYRDDLALNRDLAQRVSQLKDTILVAPWPLMHALTMPEFGYVDRALDVACAETPIDQGPRVVSMDEVARAGTTTPPRKVLWILTPNVFGGPRSRILPGDRVLVTLESGRLRAFVVERDLASSGR